MFIVLVLTILGLAFLVFGAEVLVRGAARLAAALGLSPLVIGLTVVAFGTSSPELAVSLKAQVLGSSDVALGNVVGSNICNVLLILGCTSLVAPVAISAKVIRRDVPIMIGVSFLPLLLGFNGTIGRGSGILLFTLFLAHSYWIVRTSRREAAMEDLQRSETAEEPGDSVSHHWIWNVSLVIAGLILLFLGARWVVTGAVTLARFLGVSELVIGLTVVAVSTSLPEIATSVVAGFRGQTDIAVGNVVGSNIFNILLVLGLSCSVAPRDLHVEPHALWVDIPVMIAASVACLPIFFTGRIIDRWEGGLFLLGYCAYMVYLVLRASSHAFLPTYSVIVLGFALPLVIIVLAISFIRSGRR
jgi:cation:H+ antiporter